jgi:TfoX/Sxy family transcriptional regulator of competence genes
MAFNEQLAARIREQLMDVSKLEEKQMFSGMCFMVNDKMCICVSHGEIMCRIGPDHYEAALERPGCRAMLRNGKPIEGFVYVNEKYVENKKDLTYWVNLSLAYNKRAKTSK